MVGSQIDEDMANATLLIRAVSFEIVKLDLFVTYLPESFEESKGSCIHPSLCEQ